MADFVINAEMNEPRFLELLEKLVGESKFLQNSPSQGLIPQEDKACFHILEVLKPYLKENGGVLEVEKVNFVADRGNLIIKYPGTGSEVCSFVGSHLDVVPADPAGWKRDPFKLTIEGDDLYGRGTTDCLGHVALLTDLLATLAENKPVLKRSIVVVFIANEENGSFKGVGVDQLAVEGYMEKLKNGPLFWIDAADCQPCIGTAGNAQWSLKTVGKLFHSGLPHKGMNAIEMAMDAVAYIQSKSHGTTLLARKVE
jgi:acetylornithine deacetylase